jgi:hypothetical protein
MIYIDIDNVCIDFTGTLRRHFGIELAVDDFETFHWNPFNQTGSLHCNKCHCEYCDLDSDACKNCRLRCKFPTPQEFYAKAELAPWFIELFNEVGTWETDFNFITKDYWDLKKDTLEMLYSDTQFHYVLQASDKSEFCKHPCDLLLDDNPAQIEAWRAKGGLAFWFDNSKPDIFEKFLKWRRLEK